MTPEEKEFAEQIRREAVRLAGIFGAIGQRVDLSSDIGRLAEKGGIAALGLATLAAKRNVADAVATEAAEVQAGGYDLAALASAPPSAIED